MRVVLGVSGGIAAYKAVEVCRRLVESGHFVTPVMTEAATKFVGETTFSALASEPVLKSVFDGGIPHTRLGQQADLVVVAPATADFLAHYANGIADDLLSTVVIATRAPVLVAPAMHTEMWEHPAVQENLGTLVRRGVHVVGPVDGPLAGGDSGSGRMADPQEIVEQALTLLSPKDFEGVEVLVSAGGTREAIDPVRVITNRSSGKQGHALALAAAQRGAKVVCVSTVPMAHSHPQITVELVESAKQMHDAMRARAQSADVVIMSAAVADFRPVDVSPIKGHGVPTLTLEPTQDILSDLVAHRREGQIIVGFAAETDDVIARATAKLKNKGVDLLVVNDVSAPGVGFNHDTNAVSILESTGAQTDIALSTKSAISGQILDRVASRLDLQRKAQ